VDEHQKFVLLAGQHSVHVLHCVRPNQGEQRRNMENRSTLVLGVRQRGKAAESTAFGTDRGRER